VGVCGCQGAGWGLKKPSINILWKKGEEMNGVKYISLDFIEIILYLAFP